ncbi:MAG: hypothetical protein WDW38_002155 [Sanguina aurantia]
MTESQPRQKQLASETRGADDYNSKWEKSWAAGLPPGSGFDASRSSPALLKLLRSNPEIASGKSVLIPGCGRGYDLATFLQAGARQAIGLELSPTAASEANAYLSSLPDFREEGQCYFGLANVHQGNFLAPLSQEVGCSLQGGADVGFDYTFLCALQRDMHSMWAASWAANIRPGGELVTLMFPVVERMTSSDVGAPWPLTLQRYSQLLLPEFELISMGKVPDGDSHPGREGREWMGRWRRAAAAANP